MALLMALSIVVAEDVAPVSTEATETPAELIVEEPVVVTEAEATAVVEAATEDSGITPDSILYPVDTVVEDIQLALTTDEAAQAELAIEIADERLAETAVMADEGNVEAAAEAQAGYDEAIAVAEEAVEAIESDGDAEQAAEAIEQVAEIKAQIEGHAAKVASVKDAILARMASRKTPEQLAKMQAVFDKIKAKAVQMETKTAAKKEKVAIKYKALSKKTDAEVEAKVAAIEAKVSGKVKAEQAKETASKGKKA